MIAWFRRRSAAKSLLVVAIVSGILVGEGLVLLGVSTAEQQGQRSLAERLCGWRWWDSRERAELERVVRDRSGGQVADELARQAASGLTVAQCALGVLYEQGLGVPRDLGQAAAWYREAAEQGEALAQSSLGMLYAQGRGVPRDAVLAYTWRSLAASQESQCAEDRGRRLTPQQIAEKQRLVRTWKP